MVLPAETSAFASIILPAAYIPTNGVYIFAAPPFNMSIPIQLSRSTTENSKGSGSNAGQAMQGVGKQCGSGDAHSRANAGDSAIIENGRDC